MIFSIAGIICGILVLGAGLYYLVKEKDDPESKKIYGTIAAVGVAVIVVSVLFLLAD